MKKSFERVITKLSLLIYVLAVVLRIPLTYSMFSDKEETVDNHFESAGLNLFVNPTIPIIPNLLTPGTNKILTAQFINSGELVFDYDQKYQFKSGDEELCNGLNLKVKKGMAQVYSGLLKDFIYQNGPLVLLGNHTYEYEVLLPSGADDSLSELSCSFNIVSYAWQPELSGPLVGFWDSEEFEVTIDSGKWTNCVEGAKIWAEVSISNAQGTRKDGTLVLPERSDPQAALSQADGLFYSLGVGGTVTFAFDRWVKDVPGSDISLHEITYGRDSYPVEKAKVEVSSDNIHWFEVGEVTNKDNGNGIGLLDISGSGLPWIKYVRLTDTTDYSLHSLDSDGYDLDAVDGIYALCNEPSQIFCSSITGTKKDEAGAGLKDWELIIHPQNKEPIQELIIDSKNTTGITSVNLVNGKKYLIEVSGTWTNQNSKQQVDAGFVSEDNWTNHFNYDDIAGWDPRIIDLVIDDKDVNWGTYSSNHIYKIVLSGDDATHNFKISEAGDPNPPNWYSDNQGSLTVKIYDVNEEVVSTDINGNYSKEVCGGPYQIVEVQKPGWTQVLPKEPDYYHAVLTGSSLPTFDFINKITSGLVINEVGYDVPNNGTCSEDKNEWIELYNASDNPINLKNWELRDDDGTKKMINSNTWLASHGFAVLSHDNDTWVHCISAAPGALVIQLPGPKNAWLGNDGDRLYLYNPQGMEIDFVAWEGAQSGWDLTALEGQSIARIVKGVDTNMPVDWHVLTSPNPGTNPHDSLGNILFDLINTDMISESTPTSTPIPTLEAISSESPSPTPDGTVSPLPEPTIEPTTQPIEGEIPSE